IGCAVDFVCRLLHLKIISLKKPLQIGLCNKALNETKMHCIKLLGDKLSARSFDSQVNEVHARVAVLNRFTELGRPLTQVTP
ncbi:hypothetical protein MQH21_13970, partial [Acinetobacter genomosp. 16BJ]|nr:hypothetical protein [Acinetobacter higginsii]